MRKERLCSNDRGLPSRRRSARALSAATQAKAGVGFMLIAAALASGLVFAQTSGCGRCGAPMSPISAEPPPSFSFTRTARLDMPRRGIRTESRRREAGGGSYTVCVRTCDGSFFPVSYFGPGSRKDTLAGICQSQCPNAKVELYSFPLGGTIDEAVSSTGEPYSDLPNAHKFEQSYDASCSCRGTGQTWDEALAAAEAKYGHAAHDILVTPEKSAEMARPIGGLRKLVAEAGPMRSDATIDGSGPAPLELDVNGVDKKLSAAAASISRTTSGIKDESAEDHPVYRLDQGRTVEEKAPDGASRRVRIIGSGF